MKNNASATSVFVSFLTMTKILLSTDITTILQWRKHLTLADTQPIGYCC